MWQALYNDLRDRNFMVLAVALDEPVAARPWIDAAKPEFPCLIDRAHHLAELYGFVNVPEAVWIDETGRIVRPPETAGSTDGFRSMDRKSFALPEAAAAERTHVKQVYFAAVRDWVRNPSSRHALDPARAAQRMRSPEPAIAEAHARFRLGQHLVRQGKSAEAEAQLAEAVRLHPASWSMWRQAAPKDARGLASGPAFWARVDALGSRPYYLPIDMEGLERN